MNLDDQEIIEAARAGFIEEADEMLCQFESALLQLESDPSDTELLNSAFRAAHTIKGTAGIFGYVNVVSFTHEVETLMDQLRIGHIAMTDGVSSLLFECRDHLSSLLQGVRGGDDLNPELLEKSESLKRTLQLARDREKGGGCEAVVDQPCAPRSEASEQLARAARWHVSVWFQQDALRCGLDPLAFIRYLGTLGNVTGVRVWDHDLPLLDAIDAESCYLGFEICIESHQSKAVIADVFEFAREDCDLMILSDVEPMESWQALLAHRAAEDDQRRELLLRMWADLGWQAVRHLQTKDLTSAPSTEVLVPTEKQVKQASVRDIPSHEVRHVKVRADKLDRLIDLIGELVIAGSGAQMVAEQLGVAAFQEAAQRVADLVQEARDGALALRMVPIGESFGRFHRVVRDVGKQLGKELELVISGGDTELDKSMVDLIADPLMHLVRNSLDHGIEKPETRLAAGKSKTGRLGLHAYQEAGSIVIEVSDDGQGLQAEKILAKARDRGLVDVDASLSEADILQLIFAPGFSTAEQVTDISGRGVGMDVVRRNIESLRGQISLASQSGLGTTVQIRLPLTLAMIDGFLTQVGGVHCVIPLAVVSECIDEPHECRLHATSFNGTFDLRGEVMPYLDLARFYGLKSSHCERRSVVVVSDGKRRMGLIVDRLLGEHQTVIKPLSPIFSGLDGLAGSTIMGSGEVALVIDLNGIMRMATPVAVRLH
jgi:two-component system, chemotaxis family, sensor kinase CheA